MRLYPDSVRLRVIAIILWLFGAWWMKQFGSLLTLANPWLFVAVVLVTILFLAVGIAFWVLGTDTRAGVIIDSKGMMLNLGHSAAFVPWEDVAEVGLTRHRNTILALGSSYQLGIRLHDPDRYLQSYEERLPASDGPMATVLRLMQRLIEMIGRTDRTVSRESLEQTRLQTGYHVVIPGALIGNNERVMELLELIERFCGQRQYKEDMPTSPPSLKRSETHSSWAA